MTQPSSHPDPIRVNQSLATMSLTLCHIQELIGLAYQLSCELHPSDDKQAILKTSGRLATLMHVSAQQLAAAQAETNALTQALAWKASKPPPSPTIPGKNPIIRTPSPGFPETHPLRRPDLRDNLAP